MNRFYQPRFFGTFLIKSLLLFSFSYLPQFSTRLSAQVMAISGVIKDAAGSGIPGASVKLRNTRSGVSTDSLGNFTLSVKLGSVLDISAIGYNDTAITVREATVAGVILQTRRNSLQDVVVNSNRSTVTAYDPVVFGQLLQQALSDFGEEAGFGSFSTSRGMINGPRVLGAGNKINSGAMLPYYMPKEETKGSRYLFPGYVSGIVVGSNNGLIKNTAPIYNYDKISGALIIRKDATECIEVEKSQVKGFVLKSGDTNYVFMKIPAIDINQYYALVGAGGKYVLFKSLKTKFVRSQYVNNGLVVSGNNYDEYKDESEYYLINMRNYASQPLKFLIRKRVIRQAFEEDKQNVDAYIAGHKGDEINEAFVKGLVEYIK